MMILFAFMAYAIVGLLAGMLSGLLGIGGGIVIVPALYLIFGLLGYPQAHLMHLAIGTALAAMILNTFASMYGHHKRGSVVWSVFKKMLPGLFIGSILGAIIARFLSSIVLEIAFGILLCTLAVHFWKKRPIHEEEHQMPHAVLLILWSASLGAISNILGLGGGTLVVPFLTAHKMATKKAIGTAAVCSFLITVLGTISYLILGLGQDVMPGTIGYINLPAFFGVGIASLIAAPFGVKLAHELSPHHVKRIFAVVLLLTGISMILYR